MEGDEVRLGFVLKLLSQQGVKGVQIVLGVTAAHLSKTRSGKGWARNGLICCRETIFCKAGGLV